MRGRKRLILKEHENNDRMIAWITIATQNIEILKKPQRRYKDKPLYYNVFSAFDIETTGIKEEQQSIMYTWQFAINNRVIIGRTWEQFLSFLDIIDSLHNDAMFVVYVHNLSYEFQFLSGVYNFMSDESFCLKARKIAKCMMMNRFEFRCSYILTNMSLADFTKKMNVKHQKQSAERYDYLKERFSDMGIHSRELYYQLCDVLGLVEALQIYFAIEGDNFYTIPLTSTGFVRREVKNVWKEIPYHQRQGLQPDKDVYQRLREAFRGGDTHANRYYSGITIIEPMDSYDRKSSYPAVMCTRDYPKNKLRHEGEMSVEDLEMFIFKRNTATLITVKFYDIRLKDTFFPDPYIPQSKCNEVDNPLIDNGRIISADYIEMTMTDLDYRIIKDTYIYDDIEIIDSYVSAYGLLPECLRNIIIKYFKLKTELDGVKGEEGFYLKSKEKLNSTYGMMVQNPLNEDVCFEKGEYFIKPSDKTDEELFDKVRKKAFVPYQWGVWTTAWARYELYTGIKIVEEQAATCGYPCHIYHDTDSVKALNVGGIDFTAYNKECIERAINMGAYADTRNGERKYMGVFEYEESYEAFRTLGAKKYVSMHDGALSLTCSGINKRKGAIELAKKGGIDAFEKGFIFSESDATTTQYNDNTDYYTDYKGRQLHITNNIYIYDSTYEVGITAEYETIIATAKKMLDSFKNV